MATGALVTSTAVMVVLTLLVVVLVTRAQEVRAYTHTLGVRARGVAVGPTTQSGIRVDPKMTLTVLVIAAFALAAVLLGPDPMVFVAAVGTLVLGYLAWGVYHLGRSHGMGTAHAVGLSAWFMSIVAVFGIAAKLLFG